MRTICRKKKYLPKHRQLKQHQGYQRTGRAKALRGPTLPRSLPYPQGSTLGQGKARGLKTIKLIFYFLLHCHQASSENQILSCLSFVKGPLRKHLENRGCLKKTFCLCDSHTLLVTSVLDGRFYFFCERSKRVEESVLSYAFHGNLLVPDHSNLGFFF